MASAGDCSFERGVFSLYPDLERCLSRVGEPSGIWYTVTMRLGRFDPRRVAALVPFVGNDPWVWVDGPTESPHRYYVLGAGRIRLCMWYPLDPPDQRWTYADGLVALLGHARTHLLREAFYREDVAKRRRPVWLGPEAPHGTSRLKEPLG